MKKLIQLKGFTVLELLVVVAISIVLASLVLTAVNSARSRARDSRRIADIRETKKALELYFDANRTYPAALAFLVPSYIRIEPRGPLELEGYYYTFCSAVKYHLGTDLESRANVVLESDLDRPPPECPEEDFGFAIPGAINDAGKCFGSFAVSPLVVGYCYDVSN